MSKGFFSVYWYIGANLICREILT